MRSRLLGSLLLSGMLVACGGAAPAPTAEDIPRPDLESVEPLVARVLGEAREAVERDVTSAEAWGRLGGALHAHGLHEEALRCYGHARALDDGVFLWAYLEAVAAAGAGVEPERLERAFRSAADLGADYAPLHIRWGQARLAHGMHDKARQAFERAIELDATLAVAHRGLGQTWLATGDAEKALESLLRAAELSPDDGAVHAALATVYRQLGEPDLERQAASRARSERPDASFPDPVMEQRVDPMGASARHWFARARTNLARGDYEAALDDLATVERSRPDDPDVSFLRARAFEGLGNETGAQKAIVQALLDDPDHVPALVESGRFLARRGELEPALERLRRARTLAPDDPDVLAALGPTLARAGDVDGAVEVFESLGRLLPDDARVEFNLGTLRATTGELQRAEAHFERAIALEPEYAEAHRRLAIVLESAGRPDEAREHHATADRLEPGT